MRPWLNRIRCDKYQPNRENFPTEEEAEEEEDEEGKLTGMHILAAPA